MVRRCGEEIWLPGSRRRRPKLGGLVGLGLDERAVAAVSQYTFQPATKDGSPVSVQLNVEVNFQIFRPAAGARWRREFCMRAPRLGWYHQQRRDEAGEDD